MASPIGGLILAVVAIAIETPSPEPEKSVETAIISLSLAGLERCDPPAQAADAGVTAKTWIGFAIRARSKADKVFVTPRDFTLEKGGVILQARHVDPPRLPRCSPLLKHAQLRARQAARGYVLFEVPASFRGGPEAAPLLLAYKPTRWGGAKRVELSVPACLEACPAPPAAPRPAGRRR